MDKVVVTKSKLDSLAQHINTRAGTTGAKTIAQMQATVDGIPVAEVFYIDLEGNYPDYTCPVAMVDIKAAYEAGKVLKCRCARGTDTATLSLFSLTPSADTWIFSGSCELANMGFPAQIFTVAITSNGVLARDTELVTEKDSLPNPYALTITIGSNSVSYDGSKAQAIDIPIAWAIPEQYGAVGDGVTDDTDAINACLAANRNVIFSKTYKIKADKNNYNGSSTPDRYTYGVSVPSGRTLLFGGGAKLVCQTSNAAYSAVLCLYGTSDVSIIGATIEGDRATNTLTTGEWGHGIVCRAANNVIIRDCTIYNCFGDGIVIGTSTATDENAIGSDICVENCKIYNNRRQGITIGGGKNITIKDCEIYEINGTAPQAGIDIEPNQATTEVSNVLISNCYFHDNATWDITNTNGAQTGIVIENCRCDGEVNVGTGEVAICGGSYRSIQPVGGQLTISDVTVDQIFGNPENTVVRNSKIIGNEADSYTIAFDQNNGYALTLIGCEITNVRNIILKSTGTITFVGCKIVHKTDRLFSSQGHIRAFNTVFDFSDAAVSAQPINCATIELNNCDFFTNGNGAFIGINDETAVKDWINNRFHGSLTTLSYKANRLINNVFNFSHTKIKPTATGARIGNVWTDLEEGACTDEAIKSYGYLKLEDLPKYGGGVS